MSSMSVIDVSEGLGCFSDAQLAAVDKIITDNHDKPGALIPVLEKVQDVIGYLPPAIQQHIAEGLNIPVANVYGVVTFYSFFSMTPKGRHVVRVCMGTACYVKGAQQVLDEVCSLLDVEPGGCTADKRYSVESVRCVGTCGLAPVVVINEDTHGQVKAADMEKILDQYR